MTARLSSTTDLAKALQIGKQEKNEPTKLPAPYAISSWKETSRYGVDIRELLKMDFISPVNKRGLRRFNMEWACPSAPIMMRLPFVRTGLQDQSSIKGKSTTINQSVQPDQFIQAK